MSRFYYVSIFFYYSLVSILSLYLITICFSGKNRASQRKLIPSKRSEVPNLAILGRCVKLRPTSFMEDPCLAVVRIWVKLLILYLFLFFITRFNVYRSTLTMMTIAKIILLLGLSKLYKSFAG